MRKNVNHGNFIRHVVQEVSVLVKVVEGSFHSTKVVAFVSSIV